jgi:pimeloyl-ACP methyl ester carboxylesterase
METSSVLLLYNEQMNPELLFSRRSGSGPVLVLLHGVIGSSAIWDLVTPNVVSSFDVISLDLLGYGHSPKPAGEYTPERQVRAIQQTLLHLGVNQPYNLVGLSMGALIALNLTASNPKMIRKLVCLGLTDYTTPEEAKRMTEHDIWIKYIHRHPRSAPYVIASLWGIARTIPPLSRRFAPRIYTKRMAHELFLCHFRPFNSTLEECLIHNLAAPLLDQTDQIERLFIYGTEDAWTPKQNIERDIAHRPNAELSYLQGVAHNLAVLAPSEVSALLTAFFIV